MEDLRWKTIGKIVLSTIGLSTLIIGNIFYADHLAEVRAIKAADVAYNQGLADGYRNGRASVEDLPLAERCMGAWFGGDAQSWAKSRNRLCGIKETK